MANLTESEAVVDDNTKTFAEGVYQKETTDPVEGGANGIANKAEKTLTARTLYLLKRVFEKANINSPTFTGEPEAPTPAANDNSTKIPNTSWVRALLSAYATVAWVTQQLATKANIKPSPSSNSQKINTSLTPAQGVTASLSFTPPANGLLIVTGVLNVSIPHTNFGINNKIMVNGTELDLDQTQSTQVARAIITVTAGVALSIQQKATNTSIINSTNPFSMRLDYLYIPL